MAGTSLYAEHILLYCIIQMKDLFLVLLVLTVAVANAATYNPSLARNLAYMSSIAYEPITNIKSWSCGRCGLYPLFSVKTFQITALDIQGFVGYSTILNGIVVAFRGRSLNTYPSYSQTPYRGNTYYKVNSEFYNAWNLARDLVNPLVKNFRFQFPKAPIYVTGHSLGGALATIATPDLKETFGNIGALYTFGAPQVGNKQFVNYFQIMVITCQRVVHNGDIVPHLMPAIFGYAQQGDEIWYSKGMTSYQICKSNTNSCSDAIKPSLLSSLDHDINIYVTLPITLLQTLSHYMASAWDSMTHLKLTTHS